ncbi:hypothetical protein FBUS_01908 [Fasciolopsis buskii]|uniref:Uncharacterized protein n=1 Tax=Fasciolopsis buskii TaxID=27845 RepID=A0A8E0VQQ9_9TREM|nr:hypothetical protein FBUS_01908 [Fasciolopsis buski]
MIVPTLLDIFMGLVHPVRCRLVLSDPIHHFYRLVSEPSYDTPNLRDRAGTKSADSCASLASNDSFLCTTNTTSPILSSDSATPSTHESHAVAGASPFSPGSTNLAGMQHKLAVSRQRRRRPPTRPDCWGDTDSGEQIESSILTPLNMGCTQFFTSTVTPSISLPFSHSPMDLISEEGSETDARGPRTVSVQEAESPENLNIHRESDQDGKKSPAVPPRPSLKSALTTKHHVPAMTSFKTSGNRPVSMFVSPSVTSPTQPTNHHHHEHQRSAPGPLLNTEKTHDDHGPKKPPRIKSRSASEQSHEIHSHHNRDSEQTPPTNGRYTDYGVSTINDSSGKPCTPPKDSPQNSPMTEPTPIARPRSKVSATSKIPLTLPPSDESGDCTPEKPAFKPSSTSIRPVSMFAPNATELTRPRHSTISDSSSTLGSRGSLEASQTKLPLTSLVGSHEAEKAPERTSVADRAALFGAKLHTKKPQSPPADSSIPVGRPKDVADRVSCILIDSIFELVLRIS